FTAPKRQIDVCLVFLEYLIAHDLVDQNQAGETVVAPDDVAAAADHHRRQLALTCPAQGLQDLHARGDFREVGGCAAQAHGGVCRQRDVFQDVHAPDYNSYALTAYACTAPMAGLIMKGYERTLRSL